MNIVADASVKKLIEEKGVSVGPVTEGNSSRVIMEINRIPGLSAAFDGSSIVVRQVLRD
jgi:hypothetical protein